LTTGQVANGYRLTNISVSPPTFTVFSENPELINDLPGFVETMPVDLENLEDDALISIDLNLPEGITTVKDPNVMVQVSVAAIEGSLTLTLPVEIVGLTPDLQATLSPENVDVIIAGPLFVLDQLSEEDFKVVVDLTGLPLGIYQRSPAVESYPEQVRVQTTLPETIEVTIETAPTLTPSPTNLTPAVTPTATLTRTPIVVPATNSPTPTIVIP
jgi:YbbR domain-containing protein